MFKTLIDRARNLERRLTGKAKKDAAEPLDMDVALDIADLEGDPQEWEDPEHRRRRKERRA